MWLCVIIYVLIGVMGCLEFGSNTPGNLLVAYNKDLLDGCVTSAVPATGLGL